MRPSIFPATHPVSALRTKPPEERHQHHRQCVSLTWLLEALMSKKWKRMTKNEKLDMLRDELDKLYLPTTKKAKKAAKKGTGDEEPPFST
jgi:hypothetical protein